MSSWYSNLTSSPSTPPNSRNHSRDSTHTVCSINGARTVARHALVPPPCPLPRPSPLRPPPPSTHTTPRTTTNDHAPAPLANHRRAARPRAPPAPQHSRHATHPGTARTRDGILVPRARTRRCASPRRGRACGGRARRTRHRATFGREGQGAGAARFARSCGGAQCGPKRKRAGWCRRSWWGGCAAQGCARGGGNAERDCFAVAAASIRWRSTVVLAKKSGIEFISLLYSTFF